MIYLLIQRDYLRFPAIVPVGLAQKVAAEYDVDLSDHIAKSVALLALVLKIEVSRILMG